MKDKILNAARDWLSADLTDEQTIRCIQAAFTDATHWAAEAESDSLPKISELHLDWSIDADLRDAGVTDEGMQILSFMIAEQRAATKTTETIAAL